MVYNSMLRPDELGEFRKELHQFPESSGKERKTAARVVEFCARFHPHKIVEKLGGHGLALVYEGEREGKTVLLRAELDALPLEEGIEFSHRSRHKGLSHKCGHDGHMAILCGVAARLHERPPKAGKVVLLFQPAEETGKGARTVLKDPLFQTILPHYLFALHNLPGFPEGSVIVRDHSFTFASLGMFTRIRGKSSHAAFPEQGNSPLPALAELQSRLPELPRNIPGLRDNTLLTITYSRLGYLCFGTSPGLAELAATMRAERDQDIGKMKKEIVSLVREIGEKYSLDTTLRWHEPFPPVSNAPEAVTWIRTAARKVKLPLVEMQEPFRWTEDFGEFTRNFSGAMFGLGAGTGHPDLHTPRYDFPDELLEPGVRLFEEIIRQINR